MNNESQPSSVENAPLPNATAQEGDAQLRHDAAGHAASVPPAQERDHRRLARRLKDAKLATQASLDNVLCDPERGIDKATTRQFGTCSWVQAKHNVVIVGKTGVGKSYLASALADAACRKGYRSAFFRVPRLLEELALARLAGELNSLLGRLSRVDVLVLDDFLLNPMTGTNERPGARARAAAAPEGQLPRRRSRGIRLTR